MFKNPQSVITLMLDLETLDTKNSAVITQISAVPFDMMGNWVGDRTFNEFLTIEDQLATGRTVSESTLMWWFSQSTAARLAQVNADRYATRGVLESFNRYIRKIECLTRTSVHVMGNGASFDNAKLTGLYADFGVRPAWAFFRDSDLRTVVAMGEALNSPCYKKLIPFEGVKHDAIDDCRHQIKYCQAYTRYIINGGPDGQQDPKTT